MSIDFSWVWTLCYSGALNYQASNSHLPNIVGSLSASHQGLFPRARVAFAYPGVQGDGKHPASFESSIISIAVICKNKQPVRTPITSNKTHKVDIK